jgi:hypothetical protein
MEIRPYSFKDEYAIIELFKICFNKNITYEYWDWRFNKNPFTNEKFIHLMWDGPLLVGHYAVSPIEMFIYGEKKMTALSMTTMTHPNYGGRGIFSKLATSVYENLRNSNYEMVWGFPNSKSHYGFIKNLNWLDITTLGMLKLDLNNFKISDNVSDINYFNDYSISLGKLDESQNIKINNNINYANWRYKNNPSFEYKLIASSNGNFGMVFKLIPSLSAIGQYDLDIMDIFNVEADQVRQLISFVLLHTPEKIKNVNLWCNVHSKTQIVLEKVGFVLTCPITYLGLKLFTQNSEILDYKKWDINFGYSDVF